MAIDSQLDLALGALADPTRRAILARLAAGDADVSELMKPFALSQPTISKHLGVLERAGLISSSRNAQRRPRSLVVAPLKLVADWVGQYERFWNGQLDGLDLYLRTLQPAHKSSKSTKRKERRS